MPPITAEDGRLSGEDIHSYLQAFATKFLEGKIEYGMEVRDIRRHPSGNGWHVELQHLTKDQKETQEYARIVLCTGVRVFIRVPRVVGLMTSRAAAPPMCPPN